MLRLGQQEGDWICLKLCGPPPSRNTDQDQLVERQTCPSAPGTLKPLEADIYKVLHASQNAALTYDDSIVLYTFLLLSHIFLERESRGFEMYMLRCSPIKSDCEETRVSGTKLLAARCGRGNGGGWGWRGTRKGSTARGRASNFRHAYYKGPL